MAVARSTDNRRLFSSPNMETLKNLFKPNKLEDSNAGQPVSAKEQPEPTTKDKIRAFNSIVSILAQIQQGPPFKDDELTNKNPPNHEERMRLKLSNAFAHLAVANNDVVAATLYTPEKLTVMTWIQDQISDDQDEDAQVTQQEPESKPKSISLWDKICWLFTCNTTNAAMRPGSNYQGPRIVNATQPTNYPVEGKSSKENLLLYLDKFSGHWNPPDEVSHLWVLAKMLITLKGDPTLLLRFMKYVIATSHPKINRRFATNSSKEYWQCFDSLKLEDINFRETISKKRNRVPVELENDRKFLVVLEKGKVVCDYKEQFPNIANLLKELPNDETSTPETIAHYYSIIFELFNANTYKEYHSLFMALMRKYKALVDKIATMAKKGEPLGDTLDLAAKTGHALLTMVKGRAFYLYLSTIASKLSKRFSEIKQVEVEEGNVEERSINERDDEAGILTTLWNPTNDTGTMTLWRPFKSWVMMMLVQLDTTDALCAFVNQAQLTDTAEIDVKIVYSSLVSDDTIPLEILLTQPKYIPEAPLTNQKTNAKLLDFIKTANTLKTQADCIRSFKNWDGKRVSDAQIFIGQVLDEAEKEHDEDSKQRNDGDDPNKMISELSNQILDLLPTKPAQDVILTKFAALELELKERQARYNLPFTERATFKGALHCEACLASILDKTTRESIRTRIETLKQADGKKKDDDLHHSLLQLLEDTKDFTRVIGVSKRCCPVCRCFLAYLSLDGDNTTTGFVTPGFHNTITSCTLPEWTPDRWVDGMNAIFGQILRNELVKLADAVRLQSYRSRRQSSGSGVLVGNNDTVVGDVKEDH